MTIIRLIFVAVFLFGCSSSPRAPSGGVVDELTQKHMEDRRWRSADELKRDYIKLASESSLPIQEALVKVVGTDTGNAIQSIADKIYLIENAKYTVDLTYYIFSTDIVGEAVLGALCNAVKRGVDVRIMVDSLGSFSFVHSELKGLKECENEAGYLKNRQGEITNSRARVQAVVFNALTELASDSNRRSHDKLLVVDGAYPENAFVMTGGRNISTHYYALDEIGEFDPTAFKDIEIIIRPLPNASATTSAAQLAEYYYSVLFSKPGNKFITAVLDYEGVMEKHQEKLMELKQKQGFKQAYQRAAEHTQQGFSSTKTRLAHELDNLINDNLVSNYSSNKLKNANSISGILGRVGFENYDLKKVRIVSPYLFLQSDLLKDEALIDENVNVTLEWLNKDPDRTIEIITNSVLTSDNFSTQAVIDMHTAPILLMSPEQREQWLDSDLEVNEENLEFTSSETWKKLVNHPRILFYQLGKDDAVPLGGDQYYGKLHAKFVIADDKAFVGTTNLDFRSLIYNNEMGFFLFNGVVIKELNDQFELLKSQSTRWGSDEWLSMRHKVRESGGLKGMTTKKQRLIYKTLENTGLIYQF
ncbi:phosphatidylserine/phosphatidylglycerophosphate/ cardiolipin synthase family protein [Shewanella loihica]